MYRDEEVTVVAIEEIGLRAVVGLVLLDFLPMGNKDKVEKLY
ncbi:MAG: hypothetical protein QME57_02110 [Patescibacteria group bacterium]|nr:hypothetical protein [Patescibacteria group bacterium]